MSLLTVGQGRVVLLEIPAATGAPVAFNNIAYIRIGGATPKLTDYPQRYQQLIERMQPYRWEQGIARQFATGMMCWPCSTTVSISA